ncbi:MAG: hypothetical protein GY832_39360 [Chloroflexi bacterium]|nr:hypothetical protein [Chloroflexota bacterium]
MELLIKTLIGALVVAIIHLVSQTKNIYLAGMVPLFPSFTLIAHYVVGSRGATSDLKEAILFGMFSLIPYFVYLLALYFLVDRFKLVSSLLGATFFWIVSATVLIIIWNRV